MDKRKKYDWDDIMALIAVFVIEEMTVQELKFPIELIYDEISHYASINYPEVSMPKFSQARKMIINKLKENDSFASGEQLTTKVLNRFKNIYYNSDDIEMVIQKEYDVYYYTDDIVIATLELPPDDIIKKLMHSISENKGKSEMWGKINTIQWICSRIKNRDPDNILAVIPETNRMIYLNEKGQINRKSVELEPICHSLCMFVKDTPEGHALIKKL